MIESSSRKWQDHTGYRLTQVSPTSMSGSFSSYSNHPDLAAFLPPGISTPARISKTNILAYPTIMALPDRRRTTMFIHILVHLVVMEYEQYDMIQSAAAWGPVTPLQVDCNKTSVQCWKLEH